MTETHLTGNIDTSSLTGLELLRLGLQVPEEQLPPTIGRLLGMRATRVDVGEVEFTLTTQPLFANPLGMVHGGIAATLLDSVMGCAVHSTLGAGDWYSTLEIKVNYVRGVSTDAETLRGIGTTVHVGRTTATAEGRVHDSHGRLVAHGTTTCIIRRSPST